MRDFHAENSRGDKRAGKQAFGNVHSARTSMKNNGLKNFGLIFRPLSVKGFERGGRTCTLFFMTSLHCLALLGARDYPVYVEAI